MNEIWYYKVPYEITYHSTGKTTKGEAENWVLEEVLGKKRKSISAQALKDYAPQAFNAYTSRIGLQQRILWMKIISEKRGVLYINRFIAAILGERKMLKKIER